MTSAHNPLHIVLLGSFILRYRLDIVISDQIFWDCDGSPPICDALLHTTTYLRKLDSFFKRPFYEPSS